VVRRDATAVVYAFAWNHDVVMRKGAEGLARVHDVRRLVNG
jgi:hypothetical protein